MYGKNHSIFGAKIVKDNILKKITDHNFIEAKSQNTSKENTTQNGKDRLWRENIGCGFP
jgi:hypothetical protein